MIDRDEIPMEVFAAVHDQLGTEWLRVEPDSKEPEWLILLKEQRTAKLLAWAEAVADPVLREAYLIVLGHMNDTYRMARDRRAREQQVRAIELPPLPPDLQQ